MRSAPSEAITYRKSNPYISVPEGTSMFGLGARVPTQVLGPWYQLRACVTQLVVAPCA